MSAYMQLRGSSVATSKGQTTIPKAVRDAAGIQDGTKLDWTFADGVITITAKTVDLADLAGFLQPFANGRTATVEEMNEAVSEEAAARFRRKTAR